MRSLPSALTDILAADEATDLVCLVSIHADKVIRRAFWNTDITFGGQTYTADNGGFSELRFGVDGERPGFELSLQNVADADDAAAPWATYLQSNEINGLEVRLYFTSPTALASDSTAYVPEQRWYVSGWIRVAS